MSYPPDPNNPYGQQPPPPGYGYPQQAPPPAGYGYPQQAPPQQPGYGYAQQVPPQAGYGYPQMPGTIQANNGYIAIPNLGTVQVATMGRRLAARILDSIVVWVFITIALFAGAAGLGGLAKDKVETCSIDLPQADYEACLHRQEQLGVNYGLAFLGLLAMLMVFSLLYEWLMIGLAGATIGKMAMGVRVVREHDGQHPGIGGGFMRFLVQIGGYLACGIGLLVVFLSPFFDNSGKLQGWHDRAAGTVVVRR